jgi:hypothetical protein
VTSEGGFVGPTGATTSDPGAVRAKTVEADIQLFIKMKNRAVKTDRCVLEAEPVLVLDLRSGSHDRSIENDDANVERDPWQFFG